jgi:hypothetical protein
VLKRPLSEMTSVKENSGLYPPADFTLEQNFPNPFNPNTTIRFSIPKATHVTLSIYNSLGEEIAKLVSQNLYAGIHTTEWDASGFASGVYYYRITADNFVETKKLLLLK